MYLRTMINATAQIHQTVLLREISIISPSETSSLQTELFPFAANFMFTRSQSMGEKLGRKKN
jgi:hypothetical protein